MATLGFPDWLKYEYRLPLLVQKLKEGTEFEVAGGGKVKFAYSKAAEELLLSGNRANLAKVKLVSLKDGTDYPITKIVKTAEFGGKAGTDKGGTAREDEALRSIREQLDHIKAEEKSASVPIRIGTKLHMAFDFVSTPGTPKSDFHIVDINGKELAWLSHKDGKRARDFQQWGGMTEKAEPEIFRHPETQAWLKDLTALYPNGIPSGPTVFRHIRDKRLKMLSVYGNEYGRQEGRQNVSMLLQGKVELKKQGSAYIITAYHTHLNGEDLKGEYEPVLTAKFTSGRMFGRLRNTRALILPEGSRKMQPLPPLNTKY